MVQRGRVLPAAPRGALPEVLPQERVQGLLQYRGRRALQEHQLHHLRLHLLRRLHLQLLRHLLRR